MMLEKNKAKVREIEELSMKITWLFFILNK